MKYQHFFLVLLALAISGHAVADPEVHEHYRYYDVEGADPQSIRENMDYQRSRQVKGGYDAYVSWFLEWGFRYDDDLRGCKITSASTVLTVNYTLPRWLGSGLASSKSRDRWSQYYEALLEHEHGHRDWAVNAAKDIEQSLLAMPYARDCLVLRRDAHSKASRVLAKYLRLENDYDRETQHGAMQGAVFP